MKTIAILGALAAVAVLFMANMPTNLDADAQFEEFIATYGKNYASVGEVNFRRDVFKANMKNAERLSALNPEAEFGMTIFSDQTEAEMMKRMGAIAPTTESNAPVHTEESEPNGDLDWRSSLEPVQNQGQCGSCWAFSATASFEARLKLSGKGSLMKLSEQEALDCASTQYGCNGGWYEAVWQMAQTSKFCTLASYPYKAVKGSCQKTTCDGKANDAGYKMVAKTEAAMMDALKSGPISIAVDASTWSSYRGGVVKRSACGTGMNHAVVLAGYQSKENAWVVRNSWGSGWGESGYIRLSKDENTCNLTYKPAYPTF